MKRLSGSCRSRKKPVNLLWLGGYEKRGSLREQRSRTPHLFIVGSFGQSTGFCVPTDFTKRKHGPSIIVKISRSYFAGVINRRRETVFDDVGSRNSRR